MDSSAQKPLIAFFGATGGCAGAALALALTDGYKCTALARTPSKLTALLLSKGVPQSTLSSHLTITEGDVLDTACIRTVLSLYGTPVNLIISGIGMVNLFTENTLCRSAAASILSALAALRPAEKPLLLVISTTGITAGRRDVPLLFAPLYHGLLGKPHKDKQEMERVVVEQTANGRTSESISGWVIVRASLLKNGPALGEPKVRVGREGSPAVGYTISRDDVGKWIFENFVKDGKAWMGQKVSLTY